MGRVSIAKLVVLTAATATGMCATALPANALPAIPASPLGLLASNPPALVDQLGTIFMHDQMDPNIRAAIISEISGLTSIQQRVMVAAYLVITASQYKIDT